MQQALTRRSWISSSTSARFRALPGRSARSPTASSRTSTTWGSRGRGRRRRPHRRRRGEHLRPLAPTNGGDGTPIFLCAHTDTVPPRRRSSPSSRTASSATRPDDPRRRQQGGGRVMLRRSGASSTKAAPHAGIELLFTPQGGGGAPRRGAFDPARLVARSASSTTRRRRSARSCRRAACAAARLRFHGRAAHAGMHPEEGRSAIAAAARAISDMRLGRVDEETTANVGGCGWHGGQRRPGAVPLVAEARSHDERKLGRGRAGDAGQLHVRRGRRRVRGRDELPSYRGYRLRARRAVRLAATALERCRLQAAYVVARRRRGRERLQRSAASSAWNLANGMAEIHTPDEHITVADLEGDGRGHARARRRGPPPCRGRHAVSSARHADRRRQGDQADEYRVALTPGRRARARAARARRPRRGRRRRGQRFPTTRTRRRSADRLRRRGLGSGRAAAQGEGADRGRVPAAAEGLSLFTYLHLAADAPLTRALVDSRHRRGRLRDGRDRRRGALPLLAPMSEVAGRLAAQAGAYFLEKPLGGRGLLLGGVAGRRARRACSSSAAGWSATTRRSSPSAWARR